MLSQIGTIFPFVDVEVSRPFQFVGSIMSVIWKKPAAILAAYKVAIVVIAVNFIDWIYAIHPVNTFLLTVRAIREVVVRKVTHTSII